MAVDGPWAAGSAFSAFAVSGPARLSLGIARLSLRDFLLGVS